MWCLFFLLILTFGLSVFGNMLKYMCLCVMCCMFVQFCSCPFLRVIRDVPPALNPEMFTSRVSVAVGRAEETVHVQVFLAHGRGNREGSRSLGTGAGRVVCPSNAEITGYVFRVHEYHELVICRSGRVFVFRDPAYFVGRFPRVLYRHP